MARLLLAAALVAERVEAQCGFPHPKKAARFEAAFVPAFVPCDACFGRTCTSGANAGGLCADDADCPGGGCGPLGVRGPSCAPADCPAPAFCHTANTATDIGIPSCKPPQTFNELAGSPPDGWRWGPRSRGSISFKPIKNRIVSPLNPPPNTADVAVSITLDDVRDVNGPVSFAVGQAIPQRRTTYEDRSGGDMTVIDLSIPSFPVTVVNGRARVKTSANTILNDLSVPEVPGCTALELMGFHLTDSNGHPFASLGIFVPDLPNS